MSVGARLHVFIILPVVQTDVLVFRVCTRDFVSLEYTISTKIPWK